MGYCTSFDLEYTLPIMAEDMDNKQFLNECKAAGIRVPAHVRAVLDKEFDLETRVVALLEDRNFCDYSPLIQFLNGGADTCKWYDHVDDMRRLSIALPGVLFTLKGEGEEAGDLWVKYFVNGKMQECHAEIAYPPFDEDKLK